MNSLGNSFKSYLLLFYFLLFLMALVVITSLSWRIGSDRRWFGNPAMRYEFAFIGWCHLPCCLVLGTQQEADLHVSSNNFSLIIYAYISRIMSFIAPIETGQNSTAQKLNCSSFSFKQIRCPWKAAVDGSALVGSSFLWSACRLSLLSSRADTQQRSLDYQRDNFVRRRHLSLPSGF